MKPLFESARDRLIRVAEGSTAPLRSISSFGTGTVGVLIIVGVLLAIGAYFAFSVSGLMDGYSQTINANNPDLNR